MDVAVPSEGRAWEVVPFGHIWRPAGEASAGPARMDTSRGRGAGGGGGTRGSALFWSHVSSQGTSLGGAPSSPKEGTGHERLGANVPWKHRPCEHQALCPLPCVYDRGRPSPRACEVGSALIPYFAEAPEAQRNQGICPRRNSQGLNSGRLRPECMPIYCTASHASGVRKYRTSTEGGCVAPRGQRRGPFCSWLPTAQARWCGPTARVQCWGAQNMKGVRTLQWESGEPRTAEGTAPPHRHFSLTGSSSWSGVGGTEAIKRCDSG